MSPRRHSVTVTEPVGTDPLYCEEYGYGLGRVEGILVLKYRSAAVLEFGESRQDFLHQLYWSPDGMLSTRYGARTQFVGHREAFWAHRAVTHEVRAADRQTVYRICLRETPPALTGLRAGAVSMDPEAARLIETIARPSCEEAEAFAARARLMAGLGPATSDFVGHHANGTGFALTVARALSHDPGDEAGLAEWAERLHVSVKTLQRDFEREFGMPYSKVRTKLRLSTSRVLLETRPVAEVAHRVGYSSPSAFITAFTKEYGCTPGRYAERGYDDEG
ncbi:helix-turn-helix transcriptional regulator [Nonomuraea sp. PA05]|uniref:helix-turn-helix transcriptional regulator n=1 Tax=Nonomuraea sp. PA05 TaxID=2604466 RepID=UPI0021CC64AD|nr:helix-turn-helix transcriptional regulator [Nonomuraea sp. PA05]